MFIAQMAPRAQIPKGLYVNRNVLTYNPFGIKTQDGIGAIHIQSLRDFFLPPFHHRDLLRRQAVQAVHQRVHLGLQGRGVGLWVGAQMASRAQIPKGLYVYSPDGVACANPEGIICL